MYACVYNCAISIDIYFYLILFFFLNYDKDNNFFLATDKIHKCTNSLVCNKTMLR